ncbi:hypothetical protein BGZ47_011067 [Haplosporangium gracile]|nr:hypothetical protein BGZ47_011067 [Haplosporangium gracile]
MFVVEYLEELERVQDRLDDFYNGDHMRFKRRGWDASQAREEEFKTIANRLGLVGGFIGAKRDPKNLVARSLRYIVVGINEFYISKKCPTCFEFYLQPIDKDGNYPWMEDDGSNSSPESLAKDSKTDAGSTPVPGSKRRKLIDDAENSLTPVSGTKRRQLEEDVKPFIQASEGTELEDPTL